mgnify:FL=1
MTIHIILFYKFVNIESPEKLKKEHIDFCNNLKIKGKVLFANEGINGSISGTKEQINTYKEELRKDSRFKDIEFKEETGIQNPFNKMIVRVKKEIIRLDKDIDIKNTGKHISPKEFLELSNNNKNIVILDTRNDYESKAGKFKNALLSNISTFREFPEFVNNLNIPKDTPIITYCTGGIRCEKASAYMIQQGFTNVSQIHGGIINFCQQFPNTLWEGKCFVFDDRLTSAVGQDKNNILNKCIHCKTPCDLYRNCKIKSCNKLIFICQDCKKSKHNCCSQQCMKELLR